MDNKISPKFLMNLIQQIEKELWKEFKSYKNVKYYIEKWQKENSSWWINEPFIIYEKEKGKIDLEKTLHNIDDETIIRIAIDLGIETPGFLPLTPTFKNVLKEEYPSAYESFNKASKEVLEHPDISIGLANSTLESIIKEILVKLEIDEKEIANKTLYSLTKIILKKYIMFPQQENVPSEIRDIGSSLLNIAKKIEKLRSEKTDFHGKTSVDYKIDDPLYAYFIVNSVVTVGMFLHEYYIKVINEENISNEID